MVLSVHESSNDGDTTSIEIEALDEQREAQNLEQLRRGSNISSFFSQNASLFQQQPNPNSIHPVFNQGLQNLQLNAGMMSNQNNQVMTAFNEILQKLSKQSKDIIELQQSVNSIQQQVLMQVYQANARKDSSTITSSSGSGNTPSSPLKDKNSKNTSNESLNESTLPKLDNSNQPQQQTTSLRPNTLQLLSNAQASFAVAQALRNNQQQQQQQQASTSSNVPVPNPQFSGFPSDEDDQEAKNYGLPLSMAARYVIDSKRSVTRFIRAISRRLFPEFFGSNATGIPRQYNVSGRHGKQKLDPIRYNIIIRITNRFWANTVDFPYSNVPEPIIRRAVDGLLRCKDNRRSLPIHLQEAWDKLYPHDT